MHSAPESPSYSLPSPISESTITATTPPSTRDPGKSGFFTSTKQHQHFENIKTKGRSDTAGTLDEYLQGPRDPAIHSKVPCFMRLHGSILPKMIVPVLVVGIWATAVTLISKHVHSLDVDSLLLTVLGFVVGLSLSFRSSTAYERYSEGRQFWAQIILHSRDLASLIWIHGNEREDEEQRKEDVLKKLSAINLIIAFASAVKYRIRHQPECTHDDLSPLIDHLDTYAKRATTDPAAAAVNRSCEDKKNKKRVNWVECLGLSFCTPDPRETLKQYGMRGVHHGNLPQEIMDYLSAYIKWMAESKFISSTVEGRGLAATTMMLEAFGGCERVLQTPLPVAYSIAISQITWLYVMFLPFQLYSKLGWLTIPGTIIAAYIILGIAAIGDEIENPFGTDVNDLHMDGYMDQLQYDLIIMTSKPRPNIDDVFKSSLNQPLGPYIPSGFPVWQGKNIDEIRDAARGRVEFLINRNKEENGVNMEKLGCGPELV